MPLRVPPEAPPPRVRNGAAFVYDLNTNQTRQIAADFPAAVDPVWSPDGKHIVFIGDQESRRQARKLRDLSDGHGLTCILHTTNLQPVVGYGVKGMVIQGQGFSQ